MIEILIAVGVAIALVAYYFAQRARERVATHASFQAQTFDTPEGRVTGSALRVVKMSSLSATTPNMPEDRLTKTRDEFWYCVGPGPSFFLAIPTIGIRYGQVVFVRWVIRPLSEERMRGALAGDRKAAKLAFGEAIDA